MSHSEAIRSVHVVHDADWSEAQRAAILAECNFILAHPTFKNSRRCVILLRHLIERALAGDHDAIKERTLGIEVFGRSVEYDTNSDPIVRMTANEIRKRLAQCYQESDRQPIVKIRLVPGTYVPQFDFGEPDPSLLVEGAEVFEEAPASVHKEPEENEVVPSVRSAVRGRAWMTAAAVGVLAVAVAAAVLVRSPFFRSTQYRIWEPLLDASQPVTVCVGSFNALDARPHADDPASWADQVNRMIFDRVVPQPSESRLQLPVVPMVDVMVAGKLSNWLGAHHKPSTVQRDANLTLEDLRKGPVALIGEFDNPWTLILLSDLRYHVRVDPATLDEWIEDSQHPANRAWTGSGKLGYTDSSVDYAIVTRFLDPDTGQWILEAGGLGMHGTESAGELITDPEYSKMLPANLRSGRRNFQIVLRTTVIGGNTGPPEIVAEYIW